MFLNSEAEDNVPAYKLEEKYEKVNVFARVSDPH
jgi:hypothetical protein